MGEALEYGRARKIVKVAAGRTTLDSIKSWFFMDERGTWEESARELLDLAAQNPLAATMTEDQVNGEIADVLVMRALKASIELIKKAKAG